MQKSYRSFSIHANPDSLIAAILGFFLILLFSKHSGIGISPDSVTYLSSSRHLLQGMGFQSFENKPTVDFPIGYPLFLTLISFCTGKDPLVFAPWLNGLLFGLLIYSCGAIMNRFARPSSWYKRIVLLCILTSPAFQEVYSMMWSETIFLLEILGFVILISNFLKEAGWKWLLLVSLLTAVSCITRYAAIFLVFTGCFLLFFNAGREWKQRFRDCFIFGSVSLSLFILNIIRNESVTGVATGMRVKSHVPLLQIMDYFGSVICDWLLIDHTKTLTIFLTILIICVFVIIAGYYHFHRKGVSQTEYVIPITGLFYVVFMLASYWVTRYEPFTSRLLAPVYFLLIWALTSRLPGWISGKTQGIKIVTGLSFLIVAALCIDIQFRADYEFYDGVKDAGIPVYQEDPFVFSDITQYLKNNKDSLDQQIPVFSNAGDAYYFVTGRPAWQLPTLEFPQTVETYYRGVRNRKEYLIWFNDLENTDMPDLNTLLKNKKMVLLKSFKDGSVYESL